MATVVFAASPVDAIQGQTQGYPLPHPNYYAAFNSYYQGEYKNAARQFNSLARGAYRVGSNYFLDSVCFWTMLGECSYQLGDYAAAVERYEAAIQLYENLQNWPQYTQLPNSIQTDAGGTRRSKVPWIATSTRRYTIGKFDQTMLMGFGQTPAENQQALQRGGRIDPARQRSVDVAEVMRCVALALHRRRVIKGPSCKYDPFTRQIATSLVAGGDGSIAGAWRGIANGIALASLEEWERAKNMLTSSLQINGTYDHPLTPIGLLELGYIAEKQADWATAQTMYLEASRTATAYQQADIIEESLQRASNVFLVGRKRQAYPPLELAAAWAKKERVEPLQASILIQAAMTSAEAGDGATAEQLLDQARRQMSKNDLRNGRLMMRWSYVSTMASYLQNDVARAEEAFRTFLRSAGRNSFWLYQLGLADSLVKSGAATDTDADRLYESLLREPKDEDWLLHPIETMAFQSAPHYQPLERWFAIANLRKAEDKAIRISEAIRRNRFLSTLPLGGRLIGFRWVLEAPDDALSDTAKKQKQDLLIRYPEFKQLADQSKRLRDELEQLPLVPDDKSDELFQQKTKLEQLAAIADQQELLIRKIALQREPCELAFPPPLQIPDIQRLLGPKTMVVSLLRVGSRYYVMSLSGNRYAIENHIAAVPLDRKIMELLKKIGVTGDKAAIYEASVFQNDEWRKVAKEITDMIFPTANPQAISSLEEVVFVPDGKTWYLPFELLQFGTDEQSVKLNEYVKVRYAPTLALSVPDQRLNRRFRRSAIIAKRNFARDDATLIENGLAQLLKEMPEVISVENVLAGPSSLISSTIDQLFVWHDNKESKRQGPYALTPMQLDQDMPGSDIGSWMRFPWRGVTQLVLTGYSSQIEGSTRNRADGRDLFLTTCGLMSSGARTVLISRWRVGGQSTLDLTRELALQMGDLSAVDAWHRSVQLLNQSELNLDMEPRVRSATLAEPLKADHPYFWSGYMLVDTGSAAAASDDVNNKAKLDNAAGDGK